MRRLLLLPALLLAALAQTQTVKMNAEFNGTPAGSNTYVRNADGTFTSTTELLLGTLRIFSEIKGRFEGDRIVEYSVDQQNPTGPKVHMELKNGQFTATDGKSSQSRKVDYAGASYFGNLHPQLTTMLKSVDWSKKEPQMIDAFVIEGAVVMKPKVTPQQEKPSAKGSVKQFLLALPNVEVTYSVSGDGTVVAMDVPSQKLRLVAEGWSALFSDPLAKYPELSQPTHKTITEQNIRVRMRDGVTLSADVIRPAEPGKYPVVLTRTPYGRAGTSLDGQFYASRGYVYVTQDCRGRGDSGGDWDPFVNERKDGYDTIDWAAKQPWSDGKVGMIGASYGGLVQWSAAVEKHPALKCLVPQVSPPDAMRNIPYDMGVFFLYGDIWWGKIVRQKNADMAIFEALPHPDKLNTLPLSKVDDAVLGYNVPFFDRWLDRVGDPQWPGYNWSSSLGAVAIPALHISGWWDGDEIGTMLNWDAMRAAGRKNQWLIYGPWTHIFNSTSKLGDIDYGPTAIMELDSLYLRWFDTWLKDKEVGMAKVPKVRAFVMGANKWLDMTDWPSTSSTSKTLYLFADGPAIGKNTRGQLRNAPASAQRPSEYKYDPSKAAVSKDFNPTDMDKVSTVVNLASTGDDTLIYNSSPFSKPMAIAGPIELSLYFQTSARDTDFFAMLIDTDEKGVSRVIGKAGKIRGSYIGGLDKPRPLAPGRTYKADIRLWDTAYEFGKGHKLGLILTSGMFPVYARNLGTGEPIKNATRMVVQSNKILHDAKHPSALRFRVLW